MKELLVKWKKTSKEQLFVNYLDLIGHILSYGNFSRIITMMMCFVRWLIYWVILWEIRVGQIQTSDNFYKTCWFPYYQINPMINQRIQRRFSASNLLLQKIHTWIAVPEKCSTLKKYLKTSLQGQNQTHIIYHSWISLH